MSSEKDNKTVNINLRVTEKAKEDLQKLADADRRPLSDWIRLQLEKIVEMAKKK